MRERGVSLEVIQKIAGHKSLASTGIYTEASDQEVNEAVHVLSLSPTRAMRLQEAL
jgi:site-specific recombinase XerD